MRLSQTKHKAMLTALLLAGVLLLGGCSLVVKDPEVDARQIILEVNGETVDKARFTQIYNNAYNNAYQEQLMYQQYGLIQGINLDPDQILLDTLDATAKDLLLHQKAHDLGLDGLTEEETAAIQEKAQADYDNILVQVKDAFFAQSTLTGEELDAALKAKAEELGFSMEVFVQSGKEQDLHDKLFARFAEGLTITEEELQAEYDARVSEAKTKYEQTPSAYGTDLTGGQPVYYAPAGYRYVKQILVKLTSDDDSDIKALKAELAPLGTALTEAQADADEFKALLQSESLSEADQKYLKEQQAGLSGDEAVRLGKLLALESLEAAEAEELKALQAKVPVYQALAEAQAAYDAKNDELKAKKEAALAAIQPKAEEIHALATAEGANFDDLIKEYNEDTGMPETGYPVSEASTNFVTEFTQPAMKLSSVGEVSQPSASDYGYHIMLYAADIPEGPVTLESVSETIRAELLKSKQEEAYNAGVEEWIAAAVIRKYPERMD